MWKAFGRGFDSRRLHLFPFLLLFCLITTSVFSQEKQITVFEGKKKTVVALQTVEGVPYLRISELQPFLGFELNSVVGNQNLALSAGSHSVVLSANRALVSVDGSLVSLAHPVLLQEGAWIVPIDFIQKVLKIVSSVKFLWLENNRSLILGDAQAANQLQMKYSTESGFTRLVFQSSRTVGYAVYPEQGSILIVPRSEDFVPAFQNSAFDDGILQSVSIESRNQKKAFRVTTGPAFASFRSAEFGDPPRLVLDFFRKEEAAQPAPEEPQVPPTVTPPPTLLPSEHSAQRVIVIDPGHGGTETGAKGPQGTFEKDITMSIARKLKGIIEGSTGMRVILTRDGDEVVSLDDRTAKANNNKADLFISIHANATLRGLAKGAETYFLSTQSTDDDARNTAAVENNAIGLNPEQGAALDNDLKLILWDMAQTEYLEESSRLAETIQQELNATLGISNRGIKQAPFRVLTGATMPAVLIEVGFINNPEEEKSMKDGEYQSRIAGAIFRSVEKFQEGNSANAGVINQPGQ